MNFFKVLTEAINHFINKGFDSQKSLEKWIELIKKAALKSLISPREMQRKLEESMKSAYSRLVTRGGMANKNISKNDINKLHSRLKAELDRRILASTSLIKFNREEAIASTLRRFSGWATSIPKGGFKEVDKTKEKKAIKKSLTRLPFEERRVQIDQTHKLIANINNIVAVENEAIAAEWNSHWRQINYDYREDHKERDEKLYLIKGSWAQKEGLIKPTNGYTTDITMVGEEPFCRCYYRYIYYIQDLPEEMLTVKGKKWLEDARKKRELILKS